MLPANVGTPDRIIRLILGAALILVPLLNGFGATASVALEALSIAAGAVLVLTALFRFCPLYRLFGKSTCRAHSA